MLISRKMNLAEQVLEGPAVPTEKESRYFTALQVAGAALFLAIQVLPLGLYPFIGVDIIKIAFVGLSLRAMGERL